MDVPDSEANASFGRSSGSRGESAFPQVRKTALVELGTHVETALAIGGSGDDERALARTLWDQIPADALLLEDRGFFAYEDWKSLHSRVKLLVRVKSNLVLQPIQRLADGSYLAKIYPSSYHRDKDRQGIVVRVIEYTPAAMTNLRGRMKHQHHGVTYRPHRPGATLPILPGLPKARADPVLGSLQKDCTPTG